MKIQLANDAHLDSITYPCGVQPKIDGVRAWHPTNFLVGRSMDAFKGFGITEYFSRPEFKGLDGEMILGDNPASSDRLCSATTGAMGRFKGVTEMADLHWWCFDSLDANTEGFGYKDRYKMLRLQVNQLKNPRIHLVPLEIIENRLDLDKEIARLLDVGYEGAIIRNLDAPAKEGRPSKKLQELARVKPWMDSEMLVTGITEGAMNTNEAKTNTAGHTERSSAKAGMISNGQVGSIQGTLLADVINPITGEVLFKKGLLVTIGSGEMSVKEATYYWENPDEILQHIVTFKHLAHGTKDLPRMGTFKSLRLPADMS